MREVRSGKWELGRGNRELGKCKMMKWEMERGNREVGIGKWESGIGKVQK